MVKLYPERSPILAFSEETQKILGNPVLFKGTESPDEFIF